jgi:hypothetical protein
MQHHTLRMKFRNSITRGNSNFVAFGAIYRISRELTERYNQELQSTFTGGPPGKAFVRWGQPTPISPRKSVLITGVGRFGNSILQSLNALAISRTLGASRAFFHNFEAIQNQAVSLNRDISLGQMPLKGRPESLPPDVIWRTYALNGSAPLEDPCGADYRIVRSELSRLLLGNIKEAPVHNSDETLTVYLRSGDVFRHPVPSHYGQPPWAFYRKVLAHKPWSRVEIVTEGKGNPNLDPIWKWCSARQLEVSVVGSTLPEAIRTLSRSRNIVAARGTFVPAVVYLAGLRTNIYQFDDAGSALYCPKQVSLYRVIDTKEEYRDLVLTKNWQNTEAQIALMLNYPDDAVSEILDPPR